MKKTDISDSVAIPVVLNTKPKAVSEGSEDLANCFRKKFAPLNSTMEKLEIFDVPVQTAAVVISEDELTGELPEEYGETRIVIQVRDPHLAWIYWEFSSRERKKLERKLGVFEFAHSEMFIRIFNETKHYSFEIKLPKDCNNWYAALDDSNCDYYVQLCLHTPSLGNIVLATSRTAHTPTDRVSDKMAKWVAPRPVAAPSDLVVTEDGSCSSGEREIIVEEQKIIEPVTIDGAYVGCSSEEVYRYLKEGAFAVSSDCTVVKNN